MKFLSALGWIALYVVTWFFSMLVAGIGLAAVYFIQFLSAGPPEDFFIFFVQSLNVTMLIGSIISLGLFWLILTLRRQPALDAVGLSDRLAPGHWLASVMVGAGTALALTGLMSLVQIDRFFPEETQLLAEAVSDNFILTLVAIGLIIPLFEEVFFRGLIFNELRSAMRLWPAIFLQAMIFAVFHLNLLQFIYTLPMGVLLAFLYVNWGSLWAPIAVHVAWNSLIVIMDRFLPPLSEIHLWTMLAAGLALVVVPFLVKPGDFFGSANQHEKSAV